MIRLGDSDSPKRDSILQMLRTICPEADLVMEPDGTIKVRNANVCAEEFSAASCSCRCICYLVKSERTVTIIVNAVRAAAGGGGITVDANEDGTVNGRGSNETVYIDNQNRFLPHPDWVILAHELCGHALPGMQGNHPEWRRGRFGFAPDWHQHAIEAENEIKRERGLPLR